MFKNLKYFILLLDAFNVTSYNATVKIILNEKLINIKKYLLPFEIHRFSHIKS